MDKLLVNNIIISNLKPIKNTFKNKNNKFSAKGYIGNNKVKIYEVFDQNFYLVVISQVNPFL